MILVTGATGHFGKSTIDFLLKKGISSTNIVALVRDEEKAVDLKNKGVVLRIGDYDDYTSLITAFKGIEKLLLVSGSDILKRGVQHQNVVSAAKEAGVKHIVYTSFQGKNEQETSPLWLVAQSHLQTEVWLKESGMDYTILKNTLYMDLVPAFLGEKVVETGMIFYLLVMVKLEQFYVQKWLRLLRISLQVLITQEKLTTLPTMKHSRIKRLHNFFLK